MQIELKKKEFRRLLDLAYIGNWILNSIRGEDRFRDYDRVESLLFEKAREIGWENLAGPRPTRVRPFPPAPSWRAASTRPSWSMRTACSLTSWPRTWPGGI